MRKESQVKDIYTLTPMQEGMLFHALHENRSTTYFQQVSYRMFGEIDIPLFKKSLILLFQRHDILKTAFIYKDIKRPVQVVLKEREPEFYSENLQKLESEEEKEKFVLTFKQKDRHRGFDLTHDVLLRAAVFQFNRSQYEVTWSFHHILLDGWSSGILISEFFEFYTSLVLNRPVRLAEVKPYRVYIQWLEAQDKEKSKTYWKNYLEGYEEAVCIPRLKTVTHRQDYKNTHFLTSLGEKRAAALENLAFKAQVSANTIIQSVWGTLLTKYNQKQDIVFGAVVSGRPSQIQGVEAMVGLFINTIPVRITIDWEMRFHELLRETQQNNLNSEPYHFSSLAEIQAQTLANQHLIDHILAFENYPIVQRIEGVLKELEEKDATNQRVSLEVKNIDVFEQTNYDFNLIVSPRSQFHLEFNYNANVFDIGFIKGIAHHFKVLIDQVIENEHIGIHQLTLLTGEDKHRLLQGLNHTAVNYPKGKTIHGLFAEQVERTPDNIAVLGPGEGTYNRLILSGTYRELNKKSDQLAYVLKEKGVGPDTIVGIMTERSLEMVTGILGILKAGGAYLPIDPEYPKERIDYMLADSSAKILLTSREITNLSSPDAFNNSPKGTSSFGILNLEFGISPRQGGQLAYIIYTSGTTSKPKGVLIEHNNVVRLMVNDQNRFDFSSSDIWTMFHSPCFDFSVWEMYGALLYGGKLILISRKTARDPQAYSGILKDQKVTVLNQTPSAFYNLIEEELKSPDKALTLRYVIFGGEALKPYKLKKWKEKYPETKLVNMFGITETTVHVTYKEISDREIDLNTSNIGTPIPTLCTYVLGSSMELLPIGIAGELCVGGEGVARGYLNRQELTGIKFPTTSPVPDSTPPGQRLYRSGDAARLLDNGEMEYLGRIDHQVQLRGFRVEPGEIESQLLKHNVIRDAVVLAREDETGDSYLCAYVVADNSHMLQANHLKEYLLKYLPGYMIPPFLVFLDRIPLTRNGKVNIRALPEPFGQVDPGEKYVAPTTGSEKKLADIWKNLLSLQNIGIKDDFFNIGGDSIKAIRLLNQINTQFKSDFKVIDIFEKSTIELLAAIIEPGKSREPDKDILHSEKEVKQLKEEIMANPALPAGIEDVYPMSDIQEGMVYHTGRNPGDAVYHEQFVYQVTYPGFKIEIFKKALHLTADKHPMLRTAFNTKDFNQFVQVVYRESETGLIHYDISDLDSQSQEKFINDYLKADRGKPFNFALPPLWRMILFELGKEKIAVLWVFHHTILDGWSNASLMTELNNTYLMLKSHAAFIPGKLTHTYRDFIIEQIAEKKKPGTRQYWQQQLDNFQRLDFSGLARDGARNIKVLRHNFSSGYLEKLQEAANQHRTSVKNLCFAAYCSMLNMLTRENDILVGLVTNNRPVCEDGDKILGCFLNTVPFRLIIPTPIKWTGYLRLVDEKMTQLKRFERISLFEILKITGEKTQDRNPLFDVLFNYVDFHIFREVIQENPSPGHQVSTGTSLSIDSYENTNTLFDFTVGTTFGTLTIGLKYSNSLVSDQNARRLLGYFQRSLEAILHSPGTLMRKEALLSPGERQTLIFDINDTRADFPKEKTLHRLFQNQVEKTPAQEAVTLAGNSLTYKELNARANQMARVLINKGVTTDRVVGIMVEPSLEMIVGLIGILKAGGGYLPIDPGYPWERIKFMLTDSSANVLVTTGTLAKENETLRSWEGKKKLEIILLDYYTLLPLHPSTLPSSHLHLPSAPATAVFSSTLTSTSTCQVGTANLAYVLYTSGTTGKPKGVMIEHRQVVRLLFNNKFQFDFNNKDTWTMFHSFCFDFSVWEMYGALLLGGELVLIPKMAARDPGTFLKILKEKKVTVLNQTPSAFYQLMNEELKYPGKNLNLKYVIFGGEALQPGKLKKWKEKYPDTKLINMFGITETTVHVTYKEITPAEIDLNTSNIGKPIPTLSTYVLDRELELLPIGAAGELCVGGEGISRGYLNQQELTRIKFVENPFKPEERLYRSGDLVRISANEEMEYLGRIDQQVQVKGFRIEIGEIETQLLKYNDIREAAVLAREDPAGNCYLSAYYVPEPGKELTVTQIREFLMKTLPGYMIPSYFVPMDKIPLTANNKLDRKALPAPGVKTGDQYVPPANKLQETLVSIWENVLAVEKVGISDKYFDIGGDSIKAIQLLSTINKTLNTNLKIIDLFTAETIGKLSASIDQAETPREEKELEETRSQIAELKARILAGNKLADSIQDVYPMSDIEKGMVFHSLKETGRAVYHDQIVHQLRYGNFDPRRFKKALALMVDKHPILRTGFNITRFEEPVQMVYETCAINVNHHDISTLDTNGQQQYINRVIQEDRNRPLDITTPPLWRMIIFTRDKDNVVVLWVCHHAILDGWSDASFNTELNNIYLELKTNPGYKPQPLKNTYKEFVIEQIAQKKKKPVIDFWKHELEDYKRLEFLAPIENKNMPIEVKSYFTDLGESLLEKLTAAAAANQTNIKCLCFAAYVFMLYMLSYENDLLVGLISNNRPLCEDGGKILGCFLNTVPIRITIPPRIKWRQYLRLVDQKLRQLAKYDRLSLFEILRITGQETGEQNPLFDTFFNFVDFHVYHQARQEETPGTKPASTKKRLSLKGRTENNTLLNVDISTTFENFLFKITYTPSIITDRQVEKLADYFVKALNKFIHEPGEPARKEELISPGEHRQILYELNKTDAAYPVDKTAVQWFREQTQQYAASTAIIETASNRYLTYRALDEKVNHLAVILREKGIKTGTIAALMLERSIEMITAVLAVLKAGGAYLPIALDYPPGRKEYILKDSAVKLLVSKQSEAAKFGNIVEIVDPENIPPTLYKERQNNINTVKEAGNLAYVIYTSGSTGNPKGVMVEQKAMMNTLFTLAAEYPLSERDVYLMKTFYVFDVSITELLGWYPGGSRLALLEPGQEGNPGEIIDVIKRHCVTHINFVPSMFAAFVDYLDMHHVSRLTGLKYIFLAGEALSPERVKKSGKHNNRVRLENLYGPTEAAIYASRYSLDLRDSTGDIPIGHPLKNTRLYILDIQNDLQPGEASGELCISGVGLARGYLNQPELTAQTFIPHPYSPGKRLYKTGDIARRRWDGNIMFLGRQDHQLKIRGFRVETGEIENRLRTHDKIKEAVVTAQPAPGNEVYLCAHLVPVSSPPPNDTRIASHLASQLPHYMIPSFFVWIEKIPLTASGKINRKALPLPQLKGKEHDTAPQNEKEKKLVEIWAEVLGIEKNEIGINANFFRLGGHSLKAIVISSKIHKALNIKIPLAEIFKNPTIKALSRYIQNARQHRYQSVDPIEIKDYYALSSAQQRLYILQQMDFESTAYNMPEVIPLAEEPNVEKLEETFIKLIKRHESLRTSFHMIADEPVQRIHDNVEFKIKYYEATENRRQTKDDRRKTTEGKSDTHLSSVIRHLSSEFIRPFDLSKAPLLKVGIVKTLEGGYVLVVVMHHIISDGVSLEILVKDFMALYEGKELPPLRIQYKDFSEWQNKEKHKEYIKQQERYWLRQFEGKIPELDLATDYPRPKVQLFEGSIFNDEISCNINALRTIALENGATTFILLLAIFNIFLSKVSGQEDIVLGTPVAGRRHADLERIMGLFVNSLALRNRPKREKTFMEFLKEVKERTLEAFDNQDYQFEDLVEKLAVKRDRHNPIFDVMFTCQDQGSDDTDGTGAADRRTKPEHKKDIPDAREEQSSNENKPGASKFDLYLSIVVGKKLGFSFEYSTELFRRQTIEAFAKGLKEIVLSILKNENIKLEDIKMTTTLLDTDLKSVQEELTALEF